MTMSLILQHQLIFHLQARQIRFYEDVIFRMHGVDIYYWIQNGSLQFIIITIAVVFKKS